MSDNELIFLRHAETIPDKTVKTSEWLVSKKGLQVTEKLKEKEIFQNLDVIIASAEKKAIQTASIFSNLEEIISYSELNELDRDQGEWVESKEEYQSIVKKAFLYMNKSTHNWESANSALDRFSKQIHKINWVHSNKKILIVAHGLVINLYFAMLTDEFGNLFSRWKQTTFCDYGIITNDRIVRDIIE